MFKAIRKLWSQDSWLNKRATRSFVRAEALGLGAARVSAATAFPRGGGLAHDAKRKRNTADPHARAECDANREEVPALSNAWGIVDRLRLPYHSARSRRARLRGRRGTGFSPGQQPRAREIASRFREELWDRRHGKGKANAAE